MSGSRSRTSASRSTASTPSPPRGTATTRPRGYTTAFAVTGRQERSLYGLTGGGRPTRMGGGVVIAQVSDVNDPTQSRPGEADLPVAVRRLRQRLGPHRPARRRQGPRRDGACPRSATRCWWPSSRAITRGPTSSAGSTTASTPKQQGPRLHRLRLRRGQPALVGLPARAPDRPARRGRQDRGHHRRDRGRQAASLRWTPSAPRSPCTATAPC